MYKEAHVIATEWHRLSEIDRPYYSKDYFVITSSGWITTLNYDARAKAFCFDKVTGDHIPVTYWAEIPEQILLLQEDVIVKATRR